MRDPYETPPICDRCGICGCIGECRRPREDATREAAIHRTDRVIIVTHAPPTTCPHGIDWSMWCPDCEFGAYGPGGRHVA